MDEHGHDAPNCYPSVETPEVQAAWKELRDRAASLPAESNRRKYLPTLAELIDRLSIVQLKEIFIAENKEAYAAERKLIEHDIELLFQKGYIIPNVAELIRACMMIMLANRYIWENEAAARRGEKSDNLRATHVVNGVRNTAKNVIARAVGERVDLKVDCLAADLDPSFGNWNVF